MKEYLKMSDDFKSSDMPMLVEGIAGIKGVGINKALSIMHAINCHDELVDEVERLRENLKPLGVKVIEFGNGDKVVANGKFNDEFCVFVSDAATPGSVGQDAEREWICDDYIGKNPIVIITKHEKRAKLIHMALTGQLDDVDM